MTYLTIYSLQSVQNNLELSLSLDYQYLIIKARFGKFVVRWSAIEKNLIGSLLDGTVGCLKLHEEPYGIDKISLIKECINPIIQFCWLDIPNCTLNIMDFWFDDFVRIFDQLFYSVKN